MLVLAASFALVVSAIDVESGRCPSSHQIFHALEGLLPTASGEEDGLIARVGRRGAFLEVSLRDEVGAPVAKRVLPANGGCRALAEAAAVVIAAWLDERASTGPEVRSAPPPVASEPWPPPVAPEVTRAPVPDPVAPPARPLAFEVSAAFGADHDGGSLTTAGLVDFALVSAEKWGGGLLLLDTGERAAPTSGGERRWQRYAAALAALRRWRFGRLALDGRAGLAMGMETEVRWAPGLEVGVRARLGVLFLGVEGLQWFREGRPSRRELLAAAGFTVALP